MKHIRVWGLLSVGALLLAGCRITLLPGGDDGDDTDPNEPAGVPLYETRADITITATVGATQAKVTATITDADDDNVTLETDQEVRVNGTALSGPNSFGDYTRTIPSAAEYTVTAVEPRKGQKDTLLVSPAQFEITSPLADQTVSLQGFELEW